MRGPQMIPNAGPSAQTPRPDLNAVLRTPGTRLGLRDGNIICIPPRQTGAFGQRLVGWLRPQSAEDAEAAANHSFQKMSNRYELSRVPGAGMALSLKDGARTSSFQAWRNRSANSAVAQAFIQALERDAPAELAVHMARDIRARVVHLPPKVFASQLAKLASRSDEGWNRSRANLAELRAPLLAAAGDPAMRCPKGKEESCVQRAIASWRADLLFQVQARAEAGHAPDPAADAEPSAAQLLPYLQRSVGQARDAAASVLVARDPQGADLARGALERSGAALARAAGELTQVRIDLQREWARAAIEKTQGRYDLPPESCGDPAANAKLLDKTVDKLCHSNSVSGEHRDLLRATLAKLASRPELLKGIADRALPFFAMAQARQDAGLSQARDGSHLLAVMESIASAPRPAAPPPIKVNDDAVLTNPGTRLRLTAAGSVQLVAVSETESERAVQRWTSSGLKLKTNDVTTIDWEKSRPPAAELSHLKANKPIARRFRAGLTDLSVPPIFRFLHLHQINRAAGLPEDMFANEIARLLKQQRTFGQGTVDTLAKACSALLERHGVPMQEREALVSEGLRRARDFEAQEFQPKMEKVLKEGLSMKLDSMQAGAVDAWQKSFVEEVVLERVQQPGMQALLRAQAAADGQEPA